MLSMALLRKFFVELIVVAIIVGWAVAKFPDVVTPWIPWLCLGVFWHLVWELSREGVVARWLRQRRTGVVYLIAFIIGGVASVAVLWGIRSGVEKLGVMEEHREHPEVTTDVQLSITCDNVALPMVYHGDLWTLNTVMLKSGGLIKLMPPPNKPEGLWPEEGANGFGYRCTVKNHGTQAAFGVSFPVIVSKLNFIRTGDTWTTGEAKETHSVTIWVPQPLGQQGSDQFSFYVCSYDPDGPLAVTVPSTAFINSDDSKIKREVSVKVTSIAGNPFTVPPKGPFASGHAAPTKLLADKRHPIIVATSTQVTNNATTRHIEIVITLANQTSEDVNTHITFTKFVVAPNGDRRQTDPTDERNIGFPALPFVYQLMYSFDTTQEGENSYASGSFIECIVDVAYPDTGGRTVYHFKGKTNPTINHLDYVRSEWEHSPK